MLLTYFTRDKSTIDLATGSSAVTYPLTSNAAVNAASPDYSFSADSNTGMYNPSADVLGFAVAGAKAIEVNSFGAYFYQGTRINVSFNVSGASGAYSYIQNNLVIGSNSAAAYTLDINGDAAVSGNIIADSYSGYVAAGVGANIQMSYQTTFGDIRTTTNSAELYLRGLDGVGGLNTHIKMTPGSTSDGVTLYSNNQKVAAFGDGITRIRSEIHGNSAVDAGNILWRMYANSAIGVTDWYDSNTVRARIAGSLNMKSFMASNLTLGASSADSSATTLVVNGNVAVTGDIIAFASDRRLKTNVNLITDSLYKVGQIRGVTYEWDYNELSKHEHFWPPAGLYSGVIAQEVKKVFPEAVKPAHFNNEFLTVQYEKLVPLLIEAIKELEARVKELENAATK